MNVQIQIEHWKNGSVEAIETADLLLTGGRYIHCLFFCHLSVEKALKAELVRFTEDFAPKTHHLLKLAELAGFELTEELRKDLTTLTNFCMEGRYSQSVEFNPDEEITSYWFNRTKELLIWCEKK